MGSFGYPSGGSGDYDEVWSPTAHLFKGGAMTEGRHAFETLDAMSRFSAYQEVALGPLMAGWAASDPEAAWQVLIRHPLMQNVWKVAIEGYFSGLHADAPWSEVREKVEAHCTSSDVIGGEEAMAGFRQHLAET